MHALHELKEKLMDLLEQYSKKEMTASNLDVVDKLSHSIKNLCKIIEESDYSETGGSYARGRYSREDRGMGGRSGDYSRNMMSYANERGRGSQAQRDSRGRYSSDGDMIEELRELMADAPDERSRMEFQKFIRKMETM